MSWSNAEEVKFRRDVLVNAPHRYERLEPSAAIDWIARGMTREHSALLKPRYDGPLRRKSDTESAYERRAEMARRR